jgi:hypothetical protein
MERVPQLDEIPDRDPALLQGLREHLEAARQVALQPRAPANKFARGDFEERPWRGKDTLILRDAATSFEVRYILREPAGRSWEFSFGPQLGAEELYDWLLSRK